MLPNRLIIACLILAGTLGCGLFPGGTDEIVLAPTEIGSPVGDKVTKEIGPAGGTLSSSDGRFTLTVPQNAVSETTIFAVQSITNKVQTGIGPAYRLEPDGKTFVTPVELSVRYDERELEGTAAEALAIAFQDKEGKWHVLEPTRLDDANSVVAFSTTHFTDFAFLAKMRLEPSRATLRVGETMQIRLVGCEPTDWRRPYYCRAGDPGDSHYMGLEWYTDIGTITTGINPAIYTAPPRKPRPNVATVALPFFAALPPNRPIIPGETFPTRRGVFAAHITIIDRGYRAAGSDGAMTFSGLVCRLDKPFTITGQAPQLTFKFSFTPSSSSETAGTVGVGGGGYGVILHDANATYTVNGLDTEQPTIALTMASFKGTYPGIGTATSSGTRNIQLIPLESNECAVQ